jgi:hypothetical protein
MILIDAGKFVAKVKAEHQYHLQIKRKSALLIDVTVLLFDSCLLYNYPRMAILPSPFPL